MLVLHDSFIGEEIPDLKDYSNFIWVRGIRVWSGIYHLGQIVDLEWMLGRLIVDTRLPTPPNAKTSLGHRPIISTLVL